MTHPFFFTWTDQKSAVAREVVGGDGVYFDTSDGKRWLDFGSLSYQANLGHGHKKVIEAIKKQADTLCLSAPWAVFPAKVEAAQRLLDLAPPGFSRVFFTLGGAEATENAMKMARLFTGRHKFVSRYRSYHGATMGAISISGDYRRNAVEPVLGGVIRVLDGADYFEAVMAEEGDGVAAVFLEAVPGANGVRLPTSDYFPRVRAACDRYGALLVADEVLTGFGRTGRAFAFEHFGVVPDIITVAKGVTGGFAPLGAVLVHERIADHFDENTLFGGMTLYAHPLGCAAAVAAIDAYAAENLFDRAGRLGPKLVAGLEEFRRRLPEVVANPRGLGLLAAIDVELSPDRWRRLGQALWDREVHVHAYPKRSGMVLAPPLCISEDELARGLELIGESLDEAAR